MNITTVLIFFVIIHINPYVRIVWDLLKPVEEVHYNVSCQRTSIEHRQPAGRTFRRLHQIYFIATEIRTRKRRGTGIKIQHL